MGSSLGCCSDETASTREEAGVPDLHILGQRTLAQFSMFINLSSHFFHNLSFSEKCREKQSFLNRKEAMSTSR